MKDMQEKIRFFGRIVSVQPRANVWRYRLDNPFTWHEGL